jgi:hypothetical protein
MLVASFYIWRDYSAQGFGAGPNDPIHPNHDAPYEGNPKTANLRHLVGFSECDPSLRTEISQHHSKNGPGCDNLATS